ncbi:MAG: hypothetical protein Q7S00_00425 [bacterium]|nr:hypothetical protein [bacterium]
MIDRIERPDPAYKVLESNATDDQRKDQDTEEEDEKGDKFQGKKGRDLKSLSKEKNSSRLWSRAFGAKAPSFQSIETTATEEGEDGSWTWRLKHRPLIALGILDFDNKPRWGMFMMYLLGLGGLIISLVLIIQFIYGLI